MFNIFIIMICVLLIYSFYKYTVKKLYFLNIYMSSLFLCACVLLFILTIIFNPKQSFDAALSGINLCLNVVFPSLFPFFVATELLTNLGLVHILGIILEPIMRPLFNVPGSGSFAFAMGIISGYPVGAKVIVDLKQKGLCTKTEGERLLTFCNNSGPLFILGAVAVGMFHQPAIGSILFIAHFLGSLTVGLCFRFYKSGKNKTKTYKRKQSLSLFLKRVIKQLKMVRENDGRSFGELFGDAIKNSVNLLLKIGGFIVFFSVLINLLKYLKIIQILSQLLSIFLVPLGIEEVLLPAIASGLFEITTGIKMISTHLALPFIQKLMVTSFILGWAGLSIHSQVMSIITKMNISIGPYILGKGLHGIFSAIYTYLLLYYTPLSTTVLSQYNKSFTKVTNQNILESLYLSIIYLGNLLFFLVMFCIFVVLTTTFNKNKH